MRGVITSAAVRAEKFSVRSTNAAVLTSRVPISADRRTSEDNSSGVRAPESSSWVAMPKRLKIQFEKLFNPTTIGRNIIVKISCGRARTRATGMARAKDRFFGMSSPTSMDSAVPIIIAMVKETEYTSASLLPNSGSSGVTSRRPSDGSRKNPVSNAVNVIPSWHDDSWVDSDFSAFNTGSAPLSPLSTIRCTVGTSREIKENSTATKNPFPRINRKLTPSRIHSNVTPHHSLGACQARQRHNVPRNSEAPFHSPEHGDLFSGSCVEHIFQRP